MDEVLDTPVEEVVEPVEGAEAVEGAEGAEGGAEAAGESLTGAPLWKSIKDSFQGKDPKTVAQVRKAIYDATEVGKRHPEGLKGIDAVLNSVKRLSEDSETPDAVPTEQVIEETLAERGFWREFDGKFQAGDPAVISQMAEANPEAFQKLVPEAFNKFAEVNPDGYSSIVAKAVVGYFGEQDIPLQFKLLDRIIPTESNDPAVSQLIEGYAAIKKAFEGLTAMANKPISSPEVKKQEVQNQTATPGDDPATRLRDIEWNATVAPTSNSLAVTEVQKAAGNTKFTAPEIETLKSKFREEINARVSINSGYQNALKAYLKANNKAAYIQRVNSEHAKIIKGAAARLVGDVLAARKGKAAAAASAAAKPAATKLPPEEGAIRFERIAGSPVTQNLKVDLARTPQSMLVKSQAYIVGRKNPVTWSRK
jgi:hypothetical protein